MANLMGRGNNVPVMGGATATKAGYEGLVPAPKAGDQDKVLTGAGTWVPMSGGSSLDLSAIAPAYEEGSGYIRGQLVHRDEKLYRAVVPIADETWVPAHWSEVLVSDVIPSVIQSRDMEDASFTSSMAALEDGDSVTIVFTPEGGDSADLVAGAALNARKIVPANAGKALAVNGEGTGLELTPVLPEAPTDGATYGMKNGEWKAVNVQIKTEDASEFVFTRTGSNSIGKAYLDNEDTESIPLSMSGPATYFFFHKSSVYVMTSTSNSGSSSTVYLYGTDKKIDISGFTDNTGTGVHYYDGYFYFCSRVSSSNIKITRFKEDLTSTDDYSLSGNTNLFHHSSLIGDSLFCGDSVTGDIYEFSLVSLTFKKVYSAPDSTLGYLELSKHTESGVSYYLMSRGPTCAVFDMEFNLLSSNMDVLVGDFTRIKVSSNVWLSNYGHFLKVNVDGTYELSGVVEGYNGEYALRQGIYDDSGKLTYVISNSNRYGSFDVYRYNDDNTLTFIRRYSTSLTYNVALISTYMTYVQAQAD